MCVEWPWPPTPPSAEPSQPCPGDPADEAGGSASPKPPPDSTQGFRKCNFCLQSVSNALCSLLAPRTPHLPLPVSRDCTWQQQQLHPEPLRVSLSSVNKSCFPSSFPDRADGLCPSGDPALAGRQQGRELRTISSARDKISKQASQPRTLIFLFYFTGFARESSPELHPPPTPLRAAKACTSPRTSLQAAEMDEMTLT